MKHMYAAPFGASMLYRCRQFPEGPIRSVESYEQVFQARFSSGRHSDCDSEFLLMARITVPDPLVSESQASQLLPNGDQNPQAPLGPLEAVSDQGQRFSEEVAETK